MKQRKNFNLTQEAIELLEQLAQKDGLTMTAEIELAIRERAERRGISIQKAEAE